MTWFGKFARACALVLAALAATGDRAGAQAAGKLVFASNSPYDSLDPHAVFDASRAGIRFNLYDGLYRYVDNPPRMIPWLATGHEVSADGLTYTFRLREDARFHDGTPVTSADVVYSIERILALKKGPASLYLDSVRPGSTQAPDPATVVFRLAAPSAIFLATVPDINVVNSALLKRHEVGGDWGEAWLARNEAGSGSYALTRFEPAIGWVATRFPDHFAGWGPHPVETLEFRTVLDANTRVLGMIRGDFQATDGFMSHDQIERLRGAPDVQVIDQESMRVFLLALNNSNPPMDDVHFRRALAYAFDYDGFIDGVMKGSVSRNPGPIPITMWGAPANLKGYAFDLDAARAELAQVKGPLRPLTINALAGFSESEQAAVMFQNALRRIGIESTVEVSPWSVMATRLVAPETRADVMPFWKSTFYVDPNNWAGEGFGSRFHGQRTLSYYRNPDFDALLDRALVSDDQDERRGLYERMSRMIVDDAAGIFVYNTRWHGPYSRRVAGIRFSPVNNGQDFRWASMED